MTFDETGLLSQLSKTTMIRYGFASMGALGVDAGLFLALIKTGTPPTLASLLAYCTGISVHWLLSSRMVFHDNLADQGHARRRQMALFAVSALIGLAITTAVVGMVTALHGNPQIAKLMAVAASFTATWALRRFLVFAG